MPNYIILIEVALLFFALGVAAHAFWTMGRDDDEHEFDFTPFGKTK